LVRARRKLLDEAAGGHLLAQEPYAETTPCYRGYDGDYRTLGLVPHLADLFTRLAETAQQYCAADDPKTLLYPGMYQHQAEAIRAFLVGGKDTIVATGTGSGKTECFLVPRLGMLYDEASSRPDTFALPGVRVMILYPMNALVNDQLTRLRLLFGDIGLAAMFPKDADRRSHPTFGMYTGRTPYPGPQDPTRDRERVRPLLEYYTEMDQTLEAELRRLGRYPAKDLNGFYARHLEEQKVYQLGKKRGETYTRYHWDSRLHTQPGDRELLTRQEMVRGVGTLPGQTPDILITNYSMLEYMLMRPFERPVFQETARWLAQDGSQFLLVLDEAHMYRGARGAEVGFLLRRLRARLGINDRPDKLRVICTSASLAKDREAIENVRRFAADLTGKEPGSFIAITGARAVPSDTAPGDTALADVLAAVDLDHLHATAPPEALLNTLSPFFALLQRPCPSVTDEDAILRHLYSVLDGHPVVNLLLKETAGEARSLAVLAKVLFPNHNQGRKTVEVLITLGAIARRQKDEPGLIPTRVHAMFRGLHALYACINPYCRCAICQPPTLRQRSRISDFRTKGEQPFTALIEAQFSEQPPQKTDRENRLPNKGRKVLVFSDGRQKAARLAPALEHSHARDLFRQVMAIAAAELKKQLNFTSMHMLYPAVIWMCERWGINLFPALDETEFQNHLLRARGKTLKQLVDDCNQGFLRPTQSYAQQLFSEMTDRYYSLDALALATIEEEPYVRGNFSTFPDVGLVQAAVLVLFRSWLGIQLEARRFLPPGADISSLGEGWERPEGIDANNVAHIVPRSFDDYLRRLLRDEKKYEQVETWLRHFIRESGLLRFENNRYFLEPMGLSLNLKLDAGWLRCQDCGRLYAESLAACCPACLGNVVAADADYLDARTGYYREQVRRAFDDTFLEPFGLLTAEHSAQLTGQEDEEAFNKTERYELRFQDIPIRDKERGHILPPIDVLSCMTTMEVGIDIGTLSGVALRNVPPHVANYQQRAGCAGRRGRSVASVVTYAHGTSHDAHFYTAPSRIISGDVMAPAVYIKNQKVLRRHINAYLVQRFFHETVTAGSELFRLFESLGTVEQFLSDQYPCSLSKLEAWLQTNESLLLVELRHWAPDYSYGRNAAIPEVANTINGAISELLHSLHATLPVVDYAIRAQLDGLRREGLERQLEEQLLDTLIGRAIFPCYAFPMDVVSFWVSKRKWKGDPAYKRTFDYEP
jgi:Lhr-like helicase